MKTPFDRWRGSGFVATVAANLKCPNCGRPARGCGVTVYRGIIELGCLSCHIGLLEVELHSAGQVEVVR